MNCDGIVNVEHDLPLFVEALLNASGYTPPPGCGIEQADLNDDQAYNGLDIAGFVGVLLP